MGLVLLLLWIALAASLSFNAAQFVRNGQLKADAAEAADTAESLKSALGGNMPGQESWRNDVL